MEWGWKNRVILASGAFSGQKLGFAFRNPALYLLGDDGFDNLSTPFRAVTTDLLTGKMFVPDHGNLMKAVRASMSIPGVFPPVSWDGRFLVDGYLARNLPVNVVRNRGAQHVLIITASPKYYAPNILDFGASYAGGTAGDHRSPFGRARPAMRSTPWEPNSAPTPS